MAVGYIPLPSFRAPGPLDFSSLDNALSDLGARNERDRERNRLLRKEETDLADRKGVGAALTGQATGESPYQAQPTNRLMSPAMGSAGAAGRDYSVASPGNPNLPAGMRNNNPGNIKYIPGAKYAGLVGPSVNRDQGDPQMVFDTPENGMRAASSLALRKYQGGKRTAIDLIAGNMGWTPGNTAAAANIARTMGVQPNEDLRLDDPQRMQTFLKALTLQEHGAASRGYGDDVYGAATGQRPQAAPAASPVTSAQPQGSGLNYAAGIRHALSQGNVALAMQLQNAQQEAENTAYTRGRQATQDAQSAEMHGLNVREKEDERETRFNKHVGIASQAIRNEPDPAKRQAMWNTMVSMHPGFAITLRKLGVSDVNDVDAGTKVLIAEARGITPETTQNGRYHATKQGILDSRTGQIVPGSAATTAEAPEYGTSTKAWIDDKNVVHYTQISKAGGRKDLELPAGARWAPQYDFKDTGTEFTGLNKNTGLAEVTVPKNIVGEKAAEEVGKGQGQARNALPAAKTMTDSAFRLIDELRVHPGRGAATGLSGTFDPRNYFAGTDATDFRVMNRQAQSKTFMAAREALKGAGQVTDFEGKKGEEAIAALDTAQSDGQYLKALGDLEGMIRASYNDLRIKAGEQGAATPSAPKADPLGIR